MASEGLPSPDIRDVLTFKGSNDITNIMLGTFMFISGMLLSKYKFENLKDVMSFLYKRIKRFYILYFIAALLFFLSGFIPDAKIFLTTILGVSTYILPQPFTLWFISMLFSFYILTPFVGLLSKRLKIDSIIICFIVFVFMIFFNSQISPIDTRFYYCFPAFFMGIRIGIEKENIFNAACLLGYIPLYAVFIFLRYKNISVYYLDLFCGILIFISICKLFSKILNKRALLIFNYLSYASMCMYFFHRLIYNFIKSHFANHFSIPLALLALIIVFVLSFAIQKTYDHLIKA